jgi:hypothetical protein
VDFAESGGEPRRRERRSVSGTQGGLTRTHPDRALSDRTRDPQDDDVQGDEGERRRAGERRIVALARGPKDAMRALRLRLGSSVLLLGALRAPTFAADHAARAVVLGLAPQRMKHPRRRWPQEHRRREQQPHQQRAQYMNHAMGAGVM